MPGHPLHAALWMAVAVRELLRDMGVFEILFLRTRHFRVHLARALMHLGGQWCWMYAIGALALATVFAIEFTMPVWVAVLAMVFLHERLNRGRVVMLVLGLAGIAVILRPEAGGFHPAALVMVLGSLFYAGNMIMTKRLSATDSPLAVLFRMSVVQLPITLATALPHWVIPGLADLPWIAGIGLGSFTAHYSMTRAMRLGDATLVVPIDFLRLPLIAVVGWLFYNEPFDLAIIIGASIIFAGTYYSISRESRRT